MSEDAQVRELRTANRAVVEAFFSSNLDRPEERLALWHPDGVKELPFAPAGLPKTRWEGRDEIVANTVNNSGMLGPRRCDERNRFVRGRRSGSP